MDCECAGCPPHHYIIDPATGPRSEGACLHCGESRVFNNSIDPDINPHLKKAHKNQAERDKLEEMARARDAYDRSIRVPW